MFKGVVILLVVLISPASSTLPVRLRGPSTLGIQGTMTLSSSPAAIVGPGTLANSVSLFISFTV